MLTRMPAIALLVGLMAALMLVPAIQAATEAEWLSARGFLYPALFGFFLAGALGVLLRPFGPRDTARDELLILCLAWIFLPVYACLPLILLTPGIGISGAWFEMVAALTTTGGSVFVKASNAPDAVQLWRGLVGWFGGLMTLMAAYVVLAPRRLGGYEMLAAADNLADQRSIDLRVSGALFEHRATRALRTILPIYASMTAILAVAFNLLDKPGLIAAVHAMSIVSTSGISPVDGGFAASKSYGAEAIAMLFMIAAASRLLYSDAAQTGRRANWRHDPELRLMLALAGLAAISLYLRHWLGAITAVDTNIATQDGFAALWGGIFTSVSFITTTGFVSSAWESARNWSGLANPGLVLLGLCAVGGGAATTAGGIKLIRAYALLRHGVRELERIAMPSSVAGADAGPRGLRREGAVIAWAFMMLFILALLAAVLGLTLTGLRFSDALIAAVAALSNTGPAFAVIAQQPLGFSIFDAMQHVILAIAMILGRIETIALIALFNPDHWSPRERREKRTGKSADDTSLLKW